jgi:hypothetical protein
VGSALATVETNALFAARLRDHGARAAEPRRFVYTSPNVVAGEVSLAYGLTGPSFAVGGGLHAGLEALAAAALLVESGDADRVIVVAVDEGGVVSDALSGGAIVPGAVATVVAAEAAGACARIASWRVARGAQGALGALPQAPGHRALVPLASPETPRALASSAPPDAAASVALEPL